MNLAPSIEDIERNDQARAAIEKEQENRTMILQGTDEITGQEWAGSIHPVSSEDKPSEQPRPRGFGNPINVAAGFPLDKEHALVTGKIDASEYVQAAIDKSWWWVMKQYKEWSSEAGINYPTFQGDARAWGASSAAVGIPVVLPPCTLKIDKPIELPQCVPLIGAGGGVIHGGSKLMLRGNAQIRVVGNIRTTEGPFQMISGGIAGIKFARNERIPIEILGDCSNFKISNCHFSGVGSRNSSMIHHSNAYLVDTKFGEITARKNQGHTLKEVTIEDCQFEGGSSAMNLTGGLNINIHNNTMLYTHAGIVLNNCRKVRITCNNILGTKDGEPIQVDGQAGLIVGGSDVMAFGNQFLDLDLGCVVNGSEPHLYLNDWSRVKDNYNGSSAVVDSRWRFPRTIGNFKKGDKPPFGV